MHSNKHSRICVDVNNISPVFNPDEFKAQQRQMWNNAAAGWQDWWETIERGAKKVSDKIVQLAEIKPGDKVLDIATGIGEPAVTACLLQIGQERFIKPTLNE